MSLEISWDIMMCNGCNGPSWPLWGQGSIWPATLGVCLSNGYGSKWTTPQQQMDSSISSSPKYGIIRQSNSWVIKAMAPCVDSLPTQNAGKTCFSIPTWIRSPGAGPKPPKNGCWPLAPETAKTNRCDAPRASWWSGVPGMVGPMASTRRQVEY